MISRKKNNISFLLILILGLNVYCQKIDVNKDGTLFNLSTKQEVEELSCETNSLSQILIQKRIKEDKLVLKLIIKRKNKVIKEKNIEISNNTFGGHSLPKIDLECSSGGFNLNYSISFGNEYVLFNHFFEEDHLNNFYLRNIVSYGSNRNSINMEAIKIVENLSINNYDINKVAFVELNPVFFIDNLQSTNEISIKSLLDNLKKQCYFDVLGNKKLLTIITQEIPASKNNIIYYNEIEKNLKRIRLYLETIFLSKIVLENYQNPKSHLNIGDSYWNLGNYKESIKAYKIYIELMKTQRKQNKIPK